MKSKKTRKKTPADQRTLAATVALVSSVLATGDTAKAQAPAPAPAPEASADQLPEVVVTGAEAGGYNADSLSLTKFQQPLLTTAERLGRDERADAG